MKKESFLTTLFVFLLVSLFMFFGFIEKQNDVRVIYSFGSSGNYDNLDRVNSKNSKKSKKGNSGSSSSIKNKNKYDKVDENINKIDNNSNVYFEEDMFENSEETSLTNSDNNISSDINQESSDDISSEDISSNQTEITYQDLLDRVYDLQSYGVTVFINWHNDIVDENYGVIDDIDIAKQMVYFVENIVQIMPSNYFHNIKNQGYNTQFLLVNENTNEDNSIIATMNNSNMITYIIKNNTNLTMSKFLDENYNVNINIIGSNKMNVMYYQFNKLNPSGFKYGDFNKQYIDDKCFLNIQSQKSVVDDCRNIFTRYYSKQLDTNDYLDTVLFEKISVVTNMFNKEIFY